MDEATPSAAQAMVPSLRRLAPQLIVAGVLPVVGYSLLRPHVGSDAVALAAVMVFPVAEIAVGVVLALVMLGVVVRRRRRRGGR